MQNFVTHTIDLVHGDPESKKIEIKQYFERTYAIDEQLYRILKTDEAFYRRADPLRHPLIFYLGHTAVFYINKLMLAKLIDQRINPHFESIFAIGVDEMSWDDLNEAHYNWPTVNEVWEYRAKVKALVLDVIERTPLAMPVTWENPFWIIMMGIEHERIHLETSSVLIRQLPVEMLDGSAFGDICQLQGKAPQNEYVKVDSGEVLLGKPQNHRFYGWDNEYGNVKEQVPSFETSKFLISNGEFLEFVESGGYQNHKYWTEEGWAWCNYQQAVHPRFWVKTDNSYRLRLVADIIDMPWDWPVEVNYLEAKAFAKWKSEQTDKTHRLPTEAEWYRIAGVSGIDDNNFHQTRANINLEKWSSSCPVNMHQHGQFFDVVGNVWQWTETPISGYPGFKVHPLYDDFSTPTFDAKHNIIKGGSWISTGNEHTWHSRYAFRRHFYQHAGFRLVRSNVEPKISNTFYETDSEVVRSCQLNYGKVPAAYDNFPVQLARYCVHLMQGRTNVNALDLNCDTGRAAFEMAKNFDNVTGLDFSARFIQVATRLLENGWLRYIVNNENELVDYNDVQLSDLDLEKINNIAFMQADANNLKPIYTDYDLVVAVNLLEELYAPDLFLANIHQRLNTKGIFVLGSTYNWERNKIKKEHWPGGFKRDGEPVSSFEGIKSILEKHFELEHEPFDMYMAKPLTARNFEVDVCEITVWRKR
ncbi:MAG TPA: 5-histidylcysteine sulfoxide synthase [Prolixibacteraceae bacterium]|nr:5-histidylcysteine sulfoxide synthase [Prolixibacteraceae bacterium]